WHHFPADPRDFLSAGQRLLRVPQYSGPTPRDRENTVLSSRGQSRTYQSAGAVGTSVGESAEGPAKSVRSRNGPALQRSPGGSGPLQSASAIYPRPK